MQDNMVRNAIITNVVYGDTFDADVKLGYGLTTSQRFRISGINAPEVFGAEKEKGIVSKKFVAETLLNKNVLIVNKGLDSFRRILADIYFVNDENALINIADLLVEKGLAEYRTYK
jgi:endonuclease YncB( thermonuclease family)